MAASIDPHHGEALNNLAVLEMRRQKVEHARACLGAACESPHLFEPAFNLALMHYKAGEFQVGGGMEGSVGSVGVGLVYIYTRLVCVRGCSPAYFLLTILSRRTSLPNLPPPHPSPQDAHTQVQRALALYPAHVESQELLQALQRLFQEAF